MGRSAVKVTLYAACGATALLALPSETLDGPPPRAAPGAAKFGARRLAFERNDGQTDARVAFVARSAGAAVFVQPDGLTVQPRGVGRAPMRLVFDGGRASSVDGVGRLPGHVNYLKGNDPSKWRRDVPIFERSACRGVWPGIDVVFRGDGSRLEYDFDVAPGADPAAIALRFDGADEVTVADDGDLVVRKGGDEFRNLRPRAFQEGREIAGAFVVRADGRVGFDVPGRDPSRALVIDPVVAFATYVGGRGDEAPYDAAVDANGDVFVTGTAVSVDFPLANELPGSPGGGGADAFVTKLNPSGAKFVYSTYFGGNGIDAGWGVRVDAGGIYLAGSTTSPDFPAVFAYQPTLAGGGAEGDAFLAKLTPSGADIVFSTFFGGAGDDACRALSIDKLGNCCIGGFTNSPDFPTTLGAGQGVRLGASDGWAAKFDRTGTALNWSTYLGGSSNADAVQGVAIDPVGNVFACGYTASNDFPLGAGGFRNVRGGGNIDGFLVKLGAAGAVAAGTYVGGSADDNCRRVAVDVFGFPYVAGFSLSFDMPVFNAVQGSPNGGIGTGDGFVAEFVPALNAQIFSTYFGGDDDDDVQGLAVGADGSVYVAGNTTASSFPLTNPLQAEFGGTRDAFAAKLAPAGASVTWSTYFGGSDYEAGKAIAVDADGSAYVAVSAQAAGLPVFCAAQPEYGGGRDDVYVVKFTDDAAGQPARPSSFSASATSAYRVDLAWTDASKNECSFRVERRVGDGPFATLATPDTNTTTLADLDVVPDASYAYRVYAVNPFGDSAPSDEASIDTPGTIVVSPRAGALVETPRSKLDSIRITSALRFNGQSALHAFTLPGKPLRITVGAAADPLVIDIPANDKRWRKRRSVMTWTSPPRTKPVVRVDVVMHPVSPSITIRASRFDFATTPNGAVHLSLRNGGEAGHVERAWTPIKRRPGRFKLP